MSTSDELKQRARRKADRELIPGYLKDLVADLDHWEGRLRFWQLQARIVPTDAPHYPTIQRRLANVQEILDTFTGEARQLNRKLRQTP